ETSCCNRRKWGYMHCYMRRRRPVTLMTQASYYGTTDTTRSSGASMTDAAMDLMFRWPMRGTGATMDLMVQSVQAMTGGAIRPRSNHGNGSGSTLYESSSSTSGSGVGSVGSRIGSFFSGSSSGTFDQDLSTDDLKYVIWSIVFTKPGHECILRTQQEELVNYSADASTYAAVKIAEFLDRARHGHAEKPASWEERGYLKDSKTPNQALEHDAGAKEWRIPAEDQKFICFLYKVDRRLPKQEEATRVVERVTVERNTRVA